MIALNTIGSISNSICNHFKNNRTAYCFAVTLLVLSATACAAYHQQDEEQVSRTRSGQMIYTVVNNSSTPFKNLHQTIHRLKGDDTFA